MKWIRIMYKVAKVAAEIGVKNKDKRKALDQVEAVLDDVLLPETPPQPTPQPTPPPQPQPTPQPKPRN